jgi:hypothetical protein
VLFLASIAKQVSSTISIVRGACLGARQDELRSKARQA